MKKLSMASMIAGLFVLALCLVLPLSAYSADKLVVKDSGGTNTVFVVTDTGLTGIGTGSPSGLLDVANSGGNSTVYVEGAADLNYKPQVIFRRSRGTLASPSAVMNGDFLGRLGINAYNGSIWEGDRRALQIDASENWDATHGGFRFGFYTRANGTVGGPIERIRIDHDGTVQINKLAGSYTNGSAYVCVNNSGVIYASETACP